MPLTPASKVGPLSRTSIARDPWLWGLLLCALPLILHAAGTPLGEPFADDFYFLRRALHPGSNSLLDGGGSTLFWRPLSRQVYFDLFGRLMLAQPLAIAVVHLLVLLASGALIYRALRPSWPRPWCAAVASFPLLLESNRMLVTWPSHFQDLGALLFAALALHEASRRRTWTMTLAIACSLLCKEVAAVIGLALPWIRTQGDWSRRDRMRASACIGAVLVVWAAAYMLLIPRTGIAPGYNAEVLAPVTTRVAWAMGHALRSAFSLPSDDGPAELPVVVTVGLLLVAVCVLGGASRGGRARLRAAWPLVMWGVLWWVATTLPLAGVYPLWSAQRAIVGSIGLGIALVGLLASAHPMLLLPLVALRLYAFALSPAGEGRITESPPPGAEGDFPHVERLQRLTRETRELLEARLPTLPAGSRVGLHHLPPMSRHAFAGDASLQVWYGDSTLRWVSLEDFRADPGSPVAGFVEFQSGRGPQLNFVHADAMRAQLEAERTVNSAQWSDALAHLDRADALQRDSSAPVFRGTIASLRSVCLFMLGRREEAEQHARQALEQWDGNPYSRYTLAQILIGRRQYSEADALLMSQLALYPADANSRDLLTRMRTALGNGTLR